MRGMRGIDFTPVFVGCFAAGVFVALAVVGLVYLIRWLVN